MGFCSVRALTFRLLWITRNIVIIYYYYYYCYYGIQITFVRRKKINIHPSISSCKYDLKNNIGPSNPFYATRSYSLVRTKFITEFGKLHEKLVIILFITVHVGYAIFLVKLSNTFTNKMLRARWRWPKIGRKNNNVSSRACTVA